MDMHHYIQDTILYAHIMSTGGTLFNKPSLLNID